jgi:MFS family permease
MILVRIIGKRTNEGFIGGTIALTAFRNDFGFTGKDTNTINFYSANVVSCFQGGCFFGAFFIFPITEKIGRRFALMLCAAVFQIGSLIQTLAFGHLEAIYAGRFVGGLAVGAACLIVPVFIAEISPPAIRGRMVGFFEILCTLPTPAARLPPFRNESDLKKSKLGPCSASGSRSA